MISVNEDLNYQGRPREPMIKSEVPALQEINAKSNTVRYWFCKENKNRIFIFCALGVQDGHVQSFPKYILRLGVPVRAEINPRT